jgi:glycosyltransferase involved in cell wall biosynthesis
MTRLVALIVTVRLWLYAFAFKLRADVYHCNDLDTLDIGAIMRIAKKKLVYDSHELYVAQIMQNPLRMLYLAFEKLFLKVTNVIITVNPFIGNQLRKMYHIKKRVYVVLNCPEMSSHRGLQTPIANKSNIVTVLYHGGLYADRGLENLIRAARYFRRDVRLLIRGDGGLKIELARLASGIPHVSFEKSVPMELVVEAAADADIGVLPYLPTNLNHMYCSPNKLFEYIQAGLAVVTSDLPFLRQIVVGNSVGLVFDPYDPLDIAQKINSASDKRNLSSFKRNVQRIRYRYAWDNEKTQLYSAYEELEASKRR